MVCLSVLTDTNENYVVSVITTMSTNVCEGNPCVNGGNCIDDITQPLNYRCICLLGYSGQNCETNPCSNSPCGIGGDCQNVPLAPNGFLCTCFDGFSGRVCDQTQDPCLPNPCLNGGSCTCLAGFAYFCTCITGYFGLNCQERDNPCMPNPCMNRGVCTAIGDSFSCSCVPGFSSNLCEIQANPCQPNPCLYNGQCFRVSLTESRCECRTGFVGENCQTPSSLCGNNPCRNRGTCMEDAQGVRCLCTAAFTGDLCTDPATPCTSDPCLNGGRCYYTDDRFLCVCSPNFSGTRCEISVTGSCANNPCANDGTCLPLGNGGFDCQCRLSFIGNTCQVRIDSCDTVFCNNGGTCVASGATPTCRCTPGFTGRNCEETINPCISNPCFNGGICSSNGLMFVCQCAAGFAGTNCQTRVSPCSTIPCRNGGTCVELSGTTYRCQCSPPFRGQNCEMDDCPYSCSNGGFCTLDVAHEVFTCDCPMGFAGNQCLTPLTCSVNVTILPSQLFEVASPGFPQMYPNNAHCRYYFKSAVPALPLVLEFNEINTECDYDRVEVGSGDVIEDRSTLLASLSGRETVAPIVVPGGQAWVSFDSDLWSTNRGFRLIVHDTPPTGQAVCSSNPCLNGGVCMSNGAVYICVCTQGFQGDRCESVFEGCNIQGNECVSGGLCTMANGIFVCTCPAGFGGTTCNIDINECDSGPCQNGGLCTNLRNGFNCDCVVGFTGTFCEVNERNVLAQGLSAGGLDTTPDDNEINAGWMILIIVLSVVVLAFLCFIGYRYFEERLNRETLRDAERAMRRLAERGYTNLQSDRASVFEFNNVRPPEVPASGSVHAVNTRDAPWPNSANEVLLSRL